MSLQRLGILTLLGGLLVGCVRMDTQPSSPTGTTVGKQAPNITGIDGEGSRFSLSDYHGKVVLLDFWSTT
jgi:hypothetical protein